MAAAAVDREFGWICASFELTLKCPGMLSGPHCVPFVSLRGTFGVSSGHLGQSWGALWATWACIGASWERLGIALGMPWDFSGPHSKKNVHSDTHRKPMALKYRACAQKLTRWNLPAGPAGPTVPGETVHKLPFRTYLPHAPGIRTT